MNSPTHCDLCGLPLRYGSESMAVSHKTYHFCCMGCRQVFAMLLETGDIQDPKELKKTEVYQKCLELGIIPSSEADLAQRAQFKNDPQHGNAMEEAETDVENALHLELKIQGMWCPACAWVISASLSRRTGVHSAVCNFTTDSLRCSYDPVRTSPDRIIAAVQQLGYSAGSPDEDQLDQIRKREFIRFSVSAFLTLNIMMLSFSLYAGFFTHLSESAIQKISWPMLIMATVVFFYGGKQIYHRAWTGFMAKAPGMEALISVGAGSAYLFSIFNMAKGSIHLYFDTASMLIVLVLLGKMIETRARDAVGRTLGSFFALAPKKVRLCTDHNPHGRFVRIEHLKSGDLFRVEADEIIPADGIVVQGKGTVDESAITGESRPLYKQPGDWARCGTTVVEASLTVQAKAAGEDSILGQMIAIVKNALEQKTELEGKTDWLLRWFVPLIIIIAGGTATGCLISGLPGDMSLSRAVTVLVISCPCALGIAIPLARVTGISIAGKKGILVRNFSAFEYSGQLNAFVFDKTGTLTEGRWQLQAVVCQPPEIEEDLLALAAGLEKGADHFIAAEIHRYAEKKGISAKNVENIAIHENGISGIVNGDTLKIGAADFVKAVDRPSPGKTDITDTDDGSVQSEIYLTRNDKLLGILLFGDRIKPTAARAIEILRNSEHHLALVSGDGWEATRKVGGEMKIGDVHGTMLPVEKAAFILELKTKGHVVAMVGDGINDAPALAEADLAVAVHSGYPLGRETADITLMGGDPGQIIDYLELAAIVNRKINQNLYFSFAYNIIAIPIAIAGLLSPLVAVTAMLLSSLSVTGNTLLLAKSAK